MEIVRKEEDSGKERRTEKEREREREREREEEEMCIKFQ